MRLIGSKKQSKYKKMMRTICWKIHDLMRWIRENMLCNYDLDIQSIKDEVSNMEAKAEKFNVVESIVPQIKEKLDELENTKGEIQYLKSQIEDYRYAVSELYYAEIQDDKNRRGDIYKQLIISKLIDIEIKRLQDK